MTPRNLNDKQLKLMIGNYRSSGAVEGGRWPLSELLLEERRRKPTKFPPRDVAAAIVSLSRASSDGLVSYHDLWKTFLPDTPWRGNNPRRIMANALYRVIGYCVTHGLPILTVLVVRKSERRLSPEAIENIYRESRELGVEVGTDPKRFVARERDKALNLSATSFPHDDGGPVVRVR